MSKAVAIKEVRRVPRRYRKFTPPCNHNRQLSTDAESDGQNRITRRICTQCGVSWRSVSFEKGAQVP